MTFAFGDLRGRPLINAEIRCRGRCVGVESENFKGIWMKHLQYYLDAVPGSVSKYADFIGAQESAVVHYATGEGYAVENVWYGGSQVRLCMLAKHPCSQTYAGRHHILGSVAGQ